jgi:hypothetical protein
MVSISEVMLSGETPKERAARGAGTARASSSRSSSAKARAAAARAVERVRSRAAGVFARIPGLDAAYRLLTRVAPLGRGELVERDGIVFVR